MALDDDVRILSGVGLFEGFTQEQLRLLAFGAENMRVPAGRILYREGDQADCAFVVVSGEVELFRDVEGKRVPAGKAGPGVILGEFALIADSNRLTDATVASDAELVRLSRTLFRRILEEFPEIAVALHQRIVDELQKLVSEIESLAPRFTPQD
ncbi:cyclic nucleotide-binding protein [Mesorhizobium sp. L-8-10]|uniref:Crp/Fnr family transcriptional regulator n=1 Tax=unclassified Mesorhizobium TaxID=325217 RepID=UPI001926861C|nr:MULTISPECIES: Crp/Fnr family transcriptional regulator [unclassified Mesorhizobium]BCH22321.1 cyclic nucleotide-binding protein [Mesorhizobium sp. L-8-3]BCH30134.1 cyclic nucleotide-binding protein [Mesorhizobium sp. L-8-10]